MLHTRIGASDGLLADTDFCVEHTAPISGQFAGLKVFQAHEGGKFCCRAKRQGFVAGLKLPKQSKACTNWCLC
jgi:hypothetical protein